MKRLVAKNNDKEIIDYIFNISKDYINSFTDDIANYIKRSINGDVDDLLNDEYSMEYVMKRTLRNCQGIYDDVVDQFYSNTREEMEENCLDNPNSPARYKIDDYINNLDSYGYDLKELFTPKLIEELRK